MKKHSLTPILQGYNPVSYVWHSRWRGRGGGLYELSSLNTANMQFKIRKFCHLVIPSTKTNITKFVNSLQVYLNVLFTKLLYFRNIFCPSHFPQYTHHIVAYPVIISTSETF